MISGRSLLLRSAAALLSLTASVSGLSLPAEAQLHNSLGLGSSYSGTVPPPTPAMASQHYRQQDYRQQGTPPSNNIYYSPPAVPQQYFAPHQGGPVSQPLSQAITQTSYAPPQSANPNYLPLPGGYTFDSQSVSPAPPYGQPAYELPPSWEGSVGHPQGTIYPIPEAGNGLYGSGDDEFCLACGDYRWTLLPKDLLWQSYVGGPREPRMASSIVHLDGTGWLWELEAGGRAGLLRYGSGQGQDLEGWQLDLWGAAFPRLNFEHGLDLDAADFKVGVPLTWRRGPLQFKLEWYHISSHLGDEFLLRPENAGYNRLDYLRDSIVLGAGYYVTPDVRVYAEADYAYNTGGGSAPWHFQFGLDYAPIHPTLVKQPVPFFAINGNLREEVNFGGGINIVAGLQWRGEETQHTFRTGLHYYAGESLQLSFLGDYEEFIGWGMWMDF